MNVEEVKKYAGQKVLLVLKNNFKYTVIIPNFSGNTFSVIDKFNNNITIDCEMIMLISGQNTGGPQ